jgi:hypothetical protein
LRRLVQLLELLLLLRGMMASLNLTLALPN